MLEASLCSEPLRNWGDELFNCCAGHSCTAFLMFWKVLWENVYMDAQEPECSSSDKRFCFVSQRLDAILSSCFKPFCMLYAGFTCSLVGTIFYFRACFSSVSFSGTPACSDPTCAPVLNQSLYFFFYPFQFQFAFPLQNTWRTQLDSTHPPPGQLAVMQLNSWILKNMHRYIQWRFFKRLKINVRRDSKDVQASFQRKWTKRRSPSPSGPSWRNTISHISHTLRHMTPSRHTLWRLRPSRCTSLNTVGLVGYYTDVSPARVSEGAPGSHSCKNVAIQTPALADSI